MSELKPLVIRSVKDLFSFLDTPQWRYWVETGKHHMTWTEDGPVRTEEFKEWLRKDEAS